MMRRLLKFCAGLLLIPILLVVGIHLYLQYGLTGLIHRTVLPEARRKANITIDLDHASVNLLRGRADINGFRLGNPPGFIESDLFTLQHAHLSTALTPWLRKAIHIRDCRIEGLTIQLIRQADGTMNFGRFNIPESTTHRQPGPPPPETPRDIPTPGEVPDQPPDAPPEPPVHPSDLPPFRVDQASLTATIIWIDHQSKPDLTRLETRWTADLKGIQSRSWDPASAWGSLVITAHQAAQPETEITTLRLDVAPLANPMQASFTLQGTLAATDLPGMTSTIHQAGIQCNAVSASVNLSAEEGRFKSGSRVTVHLSRPVLTDKLARKIKLKNVKLPDPLVVPVPVSGTLEKPVFDFASALVSTALQVAVQGLTGDRIESSLDGLFKSFEKSLNRKPSSP